MSWFDTGTFNWHLKLKSFDLIILLILTKLSRIESKYYS